MSQHLCYECPICGGYYPNLTKEGICEKCASNSSCVNCGDITKLNEDGLCDNCRLA